METYLRAPHAFLPHACLRLAAGDTPEPNSYGTDLQQIPSLNKQGKLHNNKDPFSSATYFQESSKSFTYSLCDRFSRCVTLMVGGQQAAKNVHNSLCSPCAPQETELSRRWFWHGRVWDKEPSTVDHMSPFWPFTLTSASIPPLSSSATVHRRSNLRCCGSTEVKMHSHAFPVH